MITKEKFNSEFNTFCTYLMPEYEKNFINEYSNEQNEDQQQCLPFLSQKKYF